MPRASKPQSAAPTGPRLVKKATEEPSVQPEVTRDQIATRAYEFFAQEGFVHGNHVDHWLRAERELSAVVAVPEPKRATGTRARR
jgi:hypothetical protein